MYKTKKFMSCRKWSKFRFWLEKQGFVLKGKNNRMSARLENVFNKTTGKRLVVLMFKGGSVKYPSSICFYIPEAGGIMQFINPGTYAGVRNLLAAAPVPPIPLLAVEHGNGFIGIMALR